MNYENIGGIIKSPDKGEGIYGATIWLTDISGVRPTDTRFMAKSDPSGRYIMAYDPKYTHLSIAAEQEGYNRRLYDLPKQITESDPNNAKNAKFDVTLAWDKGVQQIQDVTVKANADEVSCIKMGGFYDDKTNTCYLPPKAQQPTPTIPKVETKPSWWKKNWWWVVGLGVVAVGTTVFVIYKRRNKKGK